VSPLIGAAGLRQGGQDASTMHYAYTAVVMLVVHHHIQ